MRPLVVLLGIVMGSTVSIAVALLLTGVVFLLLPEYGERLAEERSPLLVACLLSVLLAGVAAASFYGELRDALLALRGARGAAGDAGGCPVDLLAKIVRAQPHEHIRAPRCGTWFRRCIAGFVAGRRRGPQGGPDRGSRLPRAYRAARVR